MSAQLAISSTVLYSKEIGFLAYFFNFSSAIRATCGSFVYFAGLADLNELHCIGSHYAVLKLDKTNQKCILHISFTTNLVVFLELESQFQLLEERMIQVERRAKNGPFSLALIGSDPSKVASFVSLEKWKQQDTFCFRYALTRDDDFVVTLYFI